MPAPFNLFLKKRLQAHLLPYVAGANKPPSLGLYIEH
jgi:hypothetical protein